SQAGRLQEIEDINAIKQLQRKYGYYVQHMLRDEIVDCFADSPDVRLNWLEGVWKGKEGVKTYFREGTPPPGFLHQVMQIEGVITLEPDGRTARGRWYAFGGINIPSPSDGKWRQSFCSGTYEFGYIKQNGIWKILTVDWMINYSVSIPQEAWSGPEMIGKLIMDPSYKPPPAAEPANPDDPRFKSGYVFPFHFTHPVTGLPTREDLRNASISGSK
ncbi:MAG TPA: nuclear transport factor 2 family protein, partial [Dehalococcoidales bacterium]|nr:nuclear transport factor 2 family protein [Dehalococcoidales bacterium]